MFASSAKTTKRSGIQRQMRLSEKKNQTFFVFAFKFLYEVVDEAVVKIFSTKMGNTSASLDFDNIVFNDKDSEGDIVPPPRSKMRTLRSPIPLLSRPYAIAVAVGSLMIRRALIPEIVAVSFFPEIVAVSFVACR